MILARLFLFSALLGSGLLLAFEISLRVAAPNLHGGPFVTDPDGFIRHSSAGRNPFGFRDEAHEFEKPRETFRIVGIGDSMGDTGGNEGNFHAVAQRRLRERGHDVEVINNCVAGHRLPDMTHMLRQHSLRYAPDVILLELTPEYQHIDGDTKEQMVINGVLTVVEKEGLTLHLRHYLRHFRERADQLKKAARTSGIETGAAATLEALANWARETGKGYLLPLEPDDLVDGAYDLDGYVQLVSSPDRMVNYLAGFEADRDAGLNRVREALTYVEEMQAVSVASGARLCVLLHATETQIDPTLLRRACARQGLDPRNVDVDLPQRRYREALDRMGIPHLDLLPLMKAHPRRPRLFAARNLHLADEGNVFVGEAIARWLVETGLLRAR